MPSFTSYTALLTLVLRGHHHNSFNPLLRQWTSSSSSSPFGGGGGGGEYKKETGVADRGKYVQNNLFCINKGVSDKPELVPKITTPYVNLQK